MLLSTTTVPPPVNRRIAGILSLHAYEARPQLCVIVCFKVWGECDNRSIFYTVGKQLSQAVDQVSPLFPEQWSAGAGQLPKHT